jgi:ElaB/YqjD/DUF883 family membrane-anchored ribosome-binding protein
MQKNERERKRPANCEMSAMNSMASDEPTQPETAEQATKCPLLEYVEHNPVAAVVQALAVGFAVGMVVRLIEGAGKKPAEIDVKRKPTLDDAKFHLGSLVLPFLWPAWQKAQEGYGKSAETVKETVKDAVGKLKSADLPREGKKHLKKAEEWAEREAEALAELGKKKAKHVEKWVEEEILPAAESGWKKLRKLFN